MSKQRDRGRILTSAALTKLQQAIRDWEVQHERKCTQERIKELTGEFKEGGLDPGTISKILKGKEGVDPESIRYLLRTFGLQLEETDLVAAIAFVAQGDPNFVGREGAIADLKTLIDRGTKVIVIQARGGVGKTTLARKYLQQEFGTFLEFPIAKETKDIASVESLIEEKLRQLGEEPGREFLVSIDRLKRKLQSERIGILIDNLEPALDSAGKLIEAHRRYVELLRVLADPTVRSLTLITTRERLREPSITVQHYPLRSLDVAAWETYFQSRNIATDESALSALHNAYGGNAKAMDILSGAIAEDFSGDIAAYWQVNQDDLLIERDLEDLVTTQFNRIQELDGDAYNLLCRMGCYRYQDVPRVPIEGLLCLLWDVAEGQRRRVVKALQDRSLVDCQDGEYWLHPVIRGEAIGRLRISDDWKTTSQKAAEFWINHVEIIDTIEDALETLEGYYHYVEVEDFESASDLMLTARKVKNSYSVPLGRVFYELGLYQQIIYAITLTVNQLSSPYSRSGLYNLLGIACRITGDVHKAIAYHENARNISSAHLALLDKNGEAFSKLNRREVNSLIDIGICKASLWEIKEAIEIFEVVINKVETYLKPFVCTFTAYLHCSFSSDSRIINGYINEVQESDLSTYALNFLAYTYAKLGERGRSSRIYKAVISRAQERNHGYILAGAQNGLACVQRSEHYFSEAIIHHLEAIEILTTIDARAELAEAYYQTGLTYQAMDGIGQCNENFQKAIRLFTEMDAPRQVERVRRSLENQA
jgi:tetratricopeptide (TPR) repeat protein